jgi:hypothetical protein
MGKIVLGFEFWALEVLGFEKKDAGKQGFDESIRFIILTIY